MGWADHLAQLNFFVKSPVLLGRAVPPGMQARRYGRIVHIDSEVAHWPPPGRSAYATAKNAQIGLARSWARELAPFGVTVNTVAPGFVPVERHADVPGEITSAYLASVPAGRMGSPGDIAHAVSFLASDGAGFHHRPAHRRRRRPLQHEDEADRRHAAGRPLAGRPAGPAIRGLFLQRPTSGYMWRGRALWRCSGECCHRR